MKHRLTIALGAALLAGTAFAADTPAHWSYEGAHGPRHWGGMQADYSACKLGHQQSPIDIRATKKEALPPLEFAYQPSPLKIIDNGHTIQVNVDGGSSITIGGQTYELKQFHFHRPSEEKIDGKSYEMVAHMVHKSAEGKLAVVGVLFTQGTESAFVQKIWDNLPTETGKEITVAGTTFNPIDLLPAKRSYYNFSGSLTTPPCSEGVNWFVLNTPVEVSRAQYARFGAMYPMNARPTQQVNGRPIQLAGE